MPEPRIVKVRPDVATSTLQRLPYFVGVSGERTGATGLSMNLVVVPPGVRPDQGGVEPGAASRDPVLG